MKRCLDSVAANHEIIVLEDGAAALRFLEKEREGLEPRPCAFVLDLHLPVHDGFEILAAIRRIPLLQHVAALLISEALSPEMQKRIVELDVPYAEKPNILSGYEALAMRVWELCESKFSLPAH